MNVQKCRVSCHIRLVSIMDKLVTLVYGDAVSMITRCLCSCMRFRGIVLLFLPFRKLAFHLTYFSFTNGLHLGN